MGIPEQILREVLKEDVKAIIGGVQFFLISEKIHDKV